MHHVYTLDLRACAKIQLDRGVFDALTRPYMYDISSNFGHFDVISSDVMIMGKTDHGQLPIYHILFNHK